MKKFGIILIVSSIIVFLIDRATNSFSTFFGKLFCGLNYLQPIDGIFGDISCGFNSDIYFVGILFVIFFIGVIFLFHRLFNNDIS